MRGSKRVALATVASLEAAALRYLERHGGSEARIRRLLAERVARSFDEHGAPARDEAPRIMDTVIEKLRRLGYLDDARFAASRARALRARGKSSFAVRAALARLGLGADAIDGAVDEADDLEAARAYVRRRRLSGGAKDLAKLARAGFSFDVARRALEAE